MEQISQCSHFHSFYNHPNSKLYFLLCLKILSCGICTDDSGTVILVGRYLRALPLQRRFISRANLITAVHAFMSTYCCSLLQYPEMPCYAMPCYTMPCYAVLCYAMLCYVRPTQSLSARPPFCPRPDNIPCTSSHAKLSRFYFSPS